MDSRLNRLNRGLQRKWKLGGKGIFYRLEVSMLKILNIYPNSKVEWDRCNRFKAIWAKKYLANVFFFFI